jgi:hypothetical protein
MNENRGTTRDRLADQLAIAILLEAFGPLGITTQACDLAAEAVLATDAIRGDLADLPAGRKMEAAR